MSKRPVRAVVVPPTGSPYPVTIEGLSDLQREVAGFIESAPSGGNYTVYCNEEGKMMGLPYNQVASRLCNLMGDVIVGAAVVVGAPDKDGFDTDIPDEVADRLLGWS